MLMVAGGVRGVSDEVRNDKGVPNVGVTKAVENDDTIVMISYWQAIVVERCVC